MRENVAVAVSAFRSDAAVVALLEAIFSDPHPEVGVVLVVDSLGTGAIARSIDANAWPVLYENSSSNLGSAGNLARRMALARNSGASWCLCLNHDANWSAERLTAMLAVARSEERVGAVYPVLDHSPRQPPWEDGRRNFEPSVRERLPARPTGTESREVLWSSSNGALYATAPLKEGLRPLAELWMGYEDLAYGIALSLRGWKQLMCREAVLANIFDYRSERLFGRVVHVPDKPAWYAYYDLRNLLLIRRRYGRAGVGLGSVFMKFIRSGLRILFLENCKVDRLSCLLKGGVAGLVGDTGKWVKP